MAHTTTADQAVSQRRHTTLIYGIAAFALATALSAIGVFGIDRQQDQVDIYPALVVFFGILTALVFALVVRPAAANGTSARRVVVLGALALVGNVVFWAGVPAVLGVATLAVRQHAPASRQTTIGVGLAVVALAANVVAAFVG